MIELHDGCPANTTPIVLSHSDGADRPARLAGDLVAADVVSVELTELLLVRCGEGTGHGWLSLTCVQ